MTEFIIEGQPAILSEHMVLPTVKDAPLNQTFWVPIDGVRVNTDHGLWLHPYTSFFTPDELTEDELINFYEIMVTDEGIEIWLNIEEEFTVDGLDDFTSYLPVKKIHVIYQPS